MRIAQIRSMDVSDGDGIGIALFTQGCPYRCVGCHNPTTWSFNAGREYTKQDEETIIKLCERPYIKRLSLLGGEPLLPDNIEWLNQLFHHLPLNIKRYIWTGTTFENLLAMANRHPEQCTDNVFASLGWTEGNMNDLKSLLSATDFVIDGRFEQDKKDLTLKWRGSSNQRIIRCHDSMEAHRVIEL